MANLSFQRWHGPEKYAIPIKKNGLDNTSPSTSHENKLNTKTTFDFSLALHLSTTNTRAFHLEATENL